MRELHVMQYRHCVVCESCMRDIRLFACLGARARRVMLPTGSPSKSVLDVVYGVMYTCSDAGTVSAFVFC